jgi:hypothetical protein
MSDFQKFRAELVARFDGLSHVLQVLTDLQGAKPSPRLTDLHNQLAQQRARLHDELVFTIAIVGQIKTGKSTLADVLFFGGRDILPTGPTPTTAALTRIDHRATGGDVAHIHYYSRDDWRRIEELAAKFTNERKPVGAQDDDLVARGCAEMVDRVRRARIDVRSWLDRQQEVPLADLARHIGPTSDHAPLIHHIQLYASEPLLEGFRVVDTPGLNDTVFSREKITRDSLNAADCVLFLSKASQFIDATDVGILQTLKDLGVERYDVLASMFDEVDGDPEHLLRDFEARLAHEAGIQRPVLPVSPLLAKLHAKISRSEALNEDEQWYVDRLRLSPAQLLVESNVELLRRHIQQLVAKQRLSMEETLRQRCDSLAQAIANYIKQVIHAAEVRLENLEVNEQAVREEVSRLDATRRTLHLKVLRPQADQVFALFQDAWKSFADGIEARVKTSIEDVSAIPDSWGNKKKHQRALDRRRSVLEDHLATRDTLLGMEDGQKLTYLELKDRLVRAIMAEPVDTPLIMDAMKDSLASGLAQILSEIFVNAARTAYSPAKILETNEPAYEQMSRTINATTLYVDPAERETILKAWRGLRATWGEAATTPISAHAFQEHVRGFFTAIFDPAFDEELRRASLGPAEKKAEIDALRGQLTDLRGALEVVQQ